MSKYVYDYKDIFEEDPTDSNQILMTIPLEIREQMNLEIGDSVKITVEDDKLIMRKNG